MERRAFDQFRKLVYERSGIALSEQKEALVSARVAKRMRALQIDTHRDYLDYVTDDRSGSEIVRLMDVITTNVTSFFREPDHFDVLRDYVKDKLGQGRRRFRFWSAACSTGEEPYSMAITISEVLGGRNADVKILATDLSTSVLRHCTAGVYEQKRVETVPSALLKRYFTKQGRNEAAQYTVGSDLRKLIVFRRLNLSRPPFPMKGPLDIVFCRNVMIYFDNRVRRALLADIYRLLAPEGYLLVGHSESLTGMVSDFGPLRPSVYRKQ